jgi:hypothetical protein
MAISLTVDLISGRVFLFDCIGGGGGSGVTSGATYPTVATFSLLPAAASHNNEIYVVLGSEGSYILNRKEAGLYYSNGIIWRRLGDIPSFFLSDNFQIIDSTDNTKGIEFVTSGISTSTFRQFTWQDKDGTVALLTDIDGKVDESIFNFYTGTTAPATYLTISAFTGYSATTEVRLTNIENQITSINNQLVALSAITETKQDKIISLQLKDISGGTEVNTIIHTPIGWTTVEYTGSSVNFTGGSRIYIQEDTDFTISYVLNSENQTNSRKQIGTLIRKNGSIDITPMSSSSYSRNISNDTLTNVMSPYKVALLNGDYIELIGFRIGNSGSVLTTPDGSWIKIEKI